MIRNALEKLITEIQIRYILLSISNKIRELLIVIMKALNYNDEQMNTILLNSTKKKGILGLFK